MTNMPLIRKTNEGRTIAVVGDVYPPEVRPNSDNAPDDRCPNSQDVHGCKGKVSHSKLDWRKDQIGYKIDDKWQGDHPIDLTKKSLQENKTKAYEDDRIEDLPDQTNGTRCRRPAWFGE